MAHYDLIIRNGDIYNASGKMITPGFVDVHTHYDGQATWDSHLNPSSNLSATTVVMGNCGVVSWSTESSGSPSGL